ncbi:hypothetical protein SEA_KEANU_9 [Streptomyces phage Keanu]|nr:hypothetical protein SEA_KEANU_9 [Streptomyces phage Keanu]
MALKSALAISASATLTGTTDLASISSPLSFNRAVQLVNGTGAGKADRMFADTRTLAASATEDLDLSGALLDALGGSAAFVRIKGLIVAASKDNTNNVVFGAASSNAWATLLNSTGTVTLRPGAAACFLAGVADVGWAVTAGTGDLLKVANSAGGTPVNYDIVVIGASA